MGSDPAGFDEEPNLERKPAPDPSVKKKNSDPTLQTNHDLESDPAS